jgi:hypothetical protein
MDSSRTELRTRTIVSFYPRYKLKVSGLVANVKQTSHCLGENRDLEVDSPGVG